MPGKSSDLKSLIKNTFFTFCRQVGVGLVGIVTVILIARIYGPGGNGTFALVMLFPTFLALLLNMGINASNVYLVSSGTSSSREVILGNLIFSLFISIFGLLIGSLIIIYKANDLFPDIDPELLWMALAIFPLSLINGFLTSIFQGLQKFNIFNKILIFEPLVFLISILAIVSTKNTDMQVLILAKIFSTTISLLLVIKEIVLIWKQSESQSSDVLLFIKKATNYGFKANLGPITQFLNYKADIFILNLFTNPATTGIYVVAVNLTEKVFLISAAVGTILFPRLSQLSSDEASRKELTPFISRIVLLITTICTICLAAVAYPVIKYLFGESYLASLSSLFILIPGVVILSTAKIWANDIAARGKPEINMYNSIVTLIVNVVGNIIFIPKYGMIGAAITTTLSYFVCAAIALKYYTKLSKNTYLSVLFVSLDDIRRIKSALKS